MDTSSSLLPIRMDTPRLTLRQWIPSDVENLAGAISSSLSELLPWMPWAAYEPASVVDRLQLIEQWRRDQQSGGSSVLGVFCGESVVGGTGLHNRIGPTALEIGYWLVTSQTGKGYASELARALTTEAFKQEGIETVEIRCDRANIRSAAVPRRLGFELAEEVREDITAPGHTGVECRYKMTRDSWQSLEPLAAD